MSKMQLHKCTSNHGRGGGGGDGGAVSQVIETFYRLLPQIW